MFDKLPSLRIVDDGDTVRLYLGGRRIEYITSENVHDNEISDSLLKIIGMSRE
jgi:hypothetical protein